MSENPDILIERLDNVVRLTLNRPQQMNAVTPQMVLALPRILDQAVKDGARAIILTGAGNAFCSGAALGGGPGSGETREQFDSLYNPLARSLARLPVPLVTAVNGGAVGAGASLALAGDIILAARSSYFMLSFARIGLVPDVGSTWLIARAAGRVRALQMALLADRMPAEEAHSGGLVTEVVDDHQLTQTAEQVARQLAAMPTRALGLIRQQIRMALENSFDHLLDVERDHQAIATQTDDFREGITAFKERRKPIFSGN
jgi:2-(1,2-epoxy-1,2-dihydrophenyl)acetyl-CoA isomerase